MTFALANYHPRLTLSNETLTARCLRTLSILLCVSWCLSAPTSFAQETTNYVSDVFYVPLHSGNSTKHRIIHRGLKSGTPLTLLETDEKAGFSRVKTAKGTEGWIQNQFLSKNPIARTLLVGARTQQQKLQDRLKQLQGEFGETSQTNKETQKQVQLLSRQNQSLTSELASLKKISANAVNLDTSNRELLKKNEILKIDIAELQADNARLADKSDKEWFLRGALAVAIGALLAVLLPKLKPKPRSREWA